MREVCTAIGAQLHADYWPTSLEPLPRELNDLVAQLVAFEILKRGSGAPTGEAMQSVMAQLAPQPRSAGRKSDPTGQWP
jgi:hypothetical protein